MRTIALSKRDIIKEAGLADTIRNAIKGSAEEAGKKLEIAEKPFETFLKTALPFMFKTNIVFKALWMIAEIMGFGPGTWVGRWLDDMFGFGDAKNPPEITEGKVEQVSTELTDKLLGGFGGLSAFAEGNFQLSKRAKLEKQAGLGKWLRILRGQSGGFIVGSVMKLLWAFLMGLVGAGIYGGVSGALLGPKSERAPGEEKDRGLEVTKKEPKLKRYRNVHSDIENSLIAYLNAFAGDIQAGGMNYNFEQVFELKKGHALQGSPEMNNILQEISSLYNYTPMEELNKMDTFYSPDIKQIMLQLLPELKKVDHKPQVKQQTKPAPKLKIKDPKKELTQLLKGVFHD